MKYCTRCKMEYRDEQELCADCGGALLTVDEEFVRQVRHMKRPVKLITLDQEPEKELLKGLLREQNITVVQTPSTGTAEDGQGYVGTWSVFGGKAEDFYVEERRLEIARTVVRDFQMEAAQLREFREAKALMIKPAFLLTTDYAAGDLQFMLEEAGIRSYYETERIYEPGQATSTTGMMTGGLVIRNHFYVDECDLERANEVAKRCMEEYLAEQETEENGAIDGDDGTEDYAGDSVTLFGWISKLFR